MSPGRDKPRAEGSVLLLATSGPSKGKPHRKAMAIDCHSLSRKTCPEGSTPPKLGRTRLAILVEERTPVLSENSARRALRERECLETVTNKAGDRQKTRTVGLTSAKSRR